MGAAVQGVQRHLSGASHLIHPAVEILDVRGEHLATIGGLTVEESVDLGHQGVDLGLRQSPLALSKLSHVRTSRILKRWVGPHFADLTHPLD